MNAGGFLALHQYTSHVTGVVSSMADNLAIGAFDLLPASTGALIAFVSGAASTAFIVNHARQRSLESEVALPLLAEAILLLGFGLIAGRYVGPSRQFVLSSTCLLCFIMGMQNALVTKISRAEIRTTHLTGIVTDIGIEIGRRVYGLKPRDEARVSLLLLLAAAFFGGALSGALGFKRFGFVATVPLALVLMLLAGASLLPSGASRESASISD